MNDSSPLGDKETERESCYAGLPEETVCSLEQCAQRIKGIIAQSARDVRQALTEARGQIGPSKSGRFQAWVKEVPGMAEQKASELIALSEQYGGL
jgi:hypothetical protein